MAKIEGLNESIAQAYLRPAANKPAANKSDLKAKGKGGAERVRKTPSLFEKLLDPVETEALAESQAAVSGDVERMLDDVHDLGGKLARNPSPDNITSYKNAVRAFMRHVVERGFNVREKTSGFNILKRKKYTTVEIVDAKLERLAAELLSTQRSQLDILGRVEEIYGLLVDLSG